MEKKKIIKIVLILIAIIVVLLVGNIVRKFSILDDITKKELAQAEADNYYQKTETRQSDGKIVMLMENYVLNGKDYKYVLEASGTKTTGIIKDNKQTIYSDNGEEKTMYINYVQNDYINKINYEEQSFWDKIKDSIKAKISSVNINGIKCYEISGTKAINNMHTEDNDVITYVEEKTGLVKRMITKSKSNNGVTSITDYEYSFGTVTKEDLEELDPTEYTLIEE